MEAKLFKHCLGFRHTTNMIYLTVNRRARKTFATVMEKILVAGKYGFMTIFFHMMPFGHFLLKAGLED